MIKRKISIKGRNLPDNKKTYENSVKDIYKNIDSIKINIESGNTVYIILEQDKNKDAKHSELYNNLSEKLDHNKSIHNVNEEKLN